mmetsp:Transcript_19397/g.61734  ORF Transcript_19397/g.61734 Transcript_19397/m.61734 type:complete len:510 (+) Transcript_19397:255-1784(+)|eukprot:CAMPEP_0182866678 /NCGR_PEP_ID=MMETSP0034_2-20130328/8322_1 /TAXON_ID=156128 /ORGANISM="Nephroselmis pyriformis, Strain CCMP717" /LENGTH=509 /DNA_ID=CAMNT_0024999007 /DNA_START=272 /DNA_END=1801 /DNA_ORIENTATION=+
MSALDKLLNSRGKKDAKTSPLGAVKPIDMQAHRRPMRPADPKPAAAAPPPARGDTYDEPPKHLTKLKTTKGRSGSTASTPRAVGFVEAKSGASPVASVTPLSVRTKRGGAALLDEAVGGTPRGTPRSLSRLAPSKTLGRGEAEAAAGVGEATPRPSRLGKARTFKEPHTPMTAKAGTYQRTGSFDHDKPSRNAATPSARMGASPSFKKVSPFAPSREVEGGGAGRVLRAGTFKRAPTTVHSRAADFNDLIDGRLEESEKKQQEYRKKAAGDSLWSVGRKFNMLKRATEKFKIVGGDSEALKRQNNKVVSGWKETMKLSEDWWNTVCNQLMSDRDLASLQETRDKMAAFASISGLDPAQIALITGYVFRICFHELFRTQLGGESMQAIWTCKELPVLRAEKAQLLHDIKVVTDGPSATPKAAAPLHPQPKRKQWKKIGAVVRLGFGLGQMGAKDEGKAAKPAETKAPPISDLEMAQLKDLRAKVAMLEGQLKTAKVSYRKMERAGGVAEL